MTTSSNPKPSGPRKLKAELSPEQRQSIIEAHKNGQSPTALAREYNRGRGTIYDTINRYKKYQTIESLPRSGRPKVLSSRAERRVLRLASRNPDWTCRMLREQIDDELSTSTIKRVLSKAPKVGNGLKGEVAKSPCISRRGGERGFGGETGFSGEVTKMG